jgi:hypothetical protein
MSKKNVHLEHIEDVILNDGVAGAHIALNFVESIVKNLAGSGNNTVNVTTKWDGSPAVICGTNPENGRFFIGTKAAFSKRSPKIIYTTNDIKKYYKDKPGLQRQLELLLTHLPKLNIGDVVLQGDMMFGENEVSEQTIDGKKYTTFKPNTILYAIPFESDLADRIRRAKMGIVFHTTYQGKTMKELTPEFSVNINDLKQHPDVWFDDATYKDVSGAVKLSSDEYDAVLRHLDAAEEALKALNPIQFEHLLTSGALISMIKMHTNEEIRMGRPIFHKDTHTNLRKFVAKRIENENIREQTKEKKQKQYDDLLNRLSMTLAKVYEFQENIVAAKMLILNKLQNIESMKTFIPRSDGGFDVSKQEGFVAVDHLTSKAVKLVDRLEFSRMNQLRFK